MYVHVYMHVYVHVYAHMRTNVIQNQFPMKMGLWRPHFLKFNWRTILFSALENMRSSSFHFFQSLKTRNSKPKTAESWRFTILGTWKNGLFGKNRRTPLWNPYVAKKKHISFSGRSYFLHSAMCRKIVSSFWALKKCNCKLQSKCMILSTLKNRNFRKNERTSLWNPSEAPKKTR